MGNENCYYYNNPHGAALKNTFLQSVSSNTEYRVMFFYLKNSASLGLFIKIIHFL